MSERTINFTMNTRTIQILADEIFLTDDEGEILTDDEGNPFTEGPGWLVRDIAFVLNPRTSQFLFAARSIGFTFKAGP